MRLDVTHPGATARPSHALPSSTPPAAQGKGPEKAEGEPTAASEASRLESARKSVERIQAELQKADAEPATGPRRAEPGIELLEILSRFGANQDSGQQEASGTRVADAYSDNQ